MNLAFVMGFFLPVPPVAGGATEKVSHALAGRFGRLGNPVTIYARCWPGMPDSVIEEAISYRRLKGWPHSRWLPLNLLRDFRWAARIVRAAGEHDVIISHSVFFPVLYRRRAGKKARVVAWIGRMPKGQTRWYDRVDAVIAPSEALAQKIREENPRLVGRILRIPYPIDWAGLSALPKPKTETVIIGYVGRIHPEKGIDILIDATVRLAQYALPSWKVLIMGPSECKSGGGGEKYLKNLQQSIPAHLRDKIEFLAPCYEPTELAAHYAKIDIFCYPSRSERGETFGVAPLEAMAAGAVPVVSDLPCFHDYLRPEINGLSFSYQREEAGPDLAGLLLGLIRDPERRQRLALQARADAAPYDYAKVAGSLRDSLSALIAP